MNRLFTLLLGFLVINYCVAQQVKHKPNPKAKVLNDSAAAKYLRANYDATKLPEIFNLLDRAIKIDSHYYEAWSNKLALLCQTDKYDAAYKSLKTMERLFPKEAEVQFLLGILEYKTNRTKDALATFNKQLKQYNTALEKKAPNAKSILVNKGIVLILVDKPAEGKALLTKLYNEEEDPYVKSSIAFYVNSTKEQIINDRLPGR